MKIFNQDIMAPLFWSLEQLRGVTQMETHHPEGDAFVHSLQVLHWAFMESYDTDLILAAMLHDVGKVSNSRKHAKIALEMLDCHCSAKTLWLIQHHMRGWDWIMGRMRRYQKSIELPNHPWFPELMQLVRWDHLGRDPRAIVEYDPLEIVDRLNRAAVLWFGPGPVAQTFIDLLPGRRTNETM